MLVKKAAPIVARPQSSGIDGLASPEPLISNIQAAASFYSQATPVAPSPDPTQPATVAAANATGTENSPVISVTPGAGAPQFDTTAPYMRRALPDEPVTMEVVVNGEAPMRFQWETFDNAQGSATPIAGCTEPTLTVALESTDTMLAFQCRVSNSACPQGVVSRTFFIKKAPRPSTPVDTRLNQQVNTTPARKAR
jgi:hypothetical protein